MAEASPAELMLFDFRRPATAGEWQIVNDDVMGGVSMGRFEMAPGELAVFSGTLSLAHSGGFASARSKAGRFDLSRFAGLALAARGDGRRYKVTLRTLPHLEWVLYQAGFETEPGVRKEHRFKSSDFLPTFRGSLLPDTPGPDWARIASIGFLISDQQAGPFRLECEWIKAVGGAAGPASGAGELRP
jgi:NADH dehydrogenase [ubiquinone] 1 alpha subcomplex assembly factor 1